MTRVYYIGDEATAAGYRLAGAATRVPNAQQALETLRIAMADDTDLVLLSAELAAALPREVVADAIVSTRPLVAVVADAHGRHPPPDVAREVRLALGIEP